MIARGDARRLATNPALIIGLLGLLGLLAMGVFGLTLAPYDPSAGTNLVMRDLPDGRTDVKVPPTLPDEDHWLGTDLLGRDQWSRILAGARLTLTIVLSAAVVRLAIGFTLGLLAGWYGGPIARAVRIVAAGINTIPQLVLAIMLVLVLQPLFRERGYIAAVALVGWPEIVEFLQSEVRRTRTQPYMEAARSTGASAPRLLRTHLVAALAPRLLTLTALEVGAVLLLLAELGLVGLFLAGGTQLVGEGEYMGTLKERAPEWGQMLGSIQFFAMQFQLSTLIPALFIVIASAIFALLADGLRVASDPFSPRGVLPGTFGVMAKTLVGAVCFSAVGFFALNATPSVLTIEEGRQLAAKTAETTWPGSQFVAGVVRFSSQSHGFDRPQRVTYYFRNDRNEVLRIAYPDGDRLAAEVGLYESEDELDFTILNPLPAGSIGWDDPIAKAEQMLGSGYRHTNPNWLVRGILTWPKDREGPVYEVVYGTNSRGQQAMRRACCFDAKSGEALDAIVLPRIPPPWPVPADCAASRQVVQHVANFPPGYFTFGQTMTVSTQQNLWFQGDNFMLILSSPTASGVTPRIERASNATEPGAHATLQNPLALGPGPGGQSQSFGSLRLTEPGCWTVRMSAGPASLEWTLYAYPYECHAPATQFPPPPGVTARPCVRP